MRNIFLGLQSILCLSIFLLIQGRFYAQDTQTNSSGRVMFLIDKSSAVFINGKAKIPSFYCHWYDFAGPVFIEKKDGFNLPTPTLLIQADHQQTPFLIYPNEKLIIKNAGTDSLFFYDPDNLQRANELRFFQELVKHTGNIYYAFTPARYHKKVSDMDSLKIFEKEINDVKKIRQLFLKNFLQKFTVGPAFEAIATNSIKSAAFTDSLVLYYNNRNILIRNNLYNNLIAKKFQDFKHIEFSPFQIYYRAAQSIVSMSVNGNPNSGIVDSNDLKKKFDSALKYSDGKSKDYMIFNTLLAAYKSSIPIPKQYANKFNTLCSDERYKNIIKTKLIENVNIAYKSEGNTLVGASANSYKNLDDILLKNKDNLIIIDFWASWCAPCRAEMPASIKLQKTYEKKSVVYLYIAINDDKSNWLKAIKDEGLKPNNNFLMPNSDNAPFVKQHNIGTIPRYIIIGKGGQIISENAPRPRDPELGSIINRNL